MTNTKQGRGRNLKEVPQNSTEVFNIYNIKANESFRETSIAKKNKHT